MYLAKSCYKKDHIQSRKTIRLGSLHEYRATEDEQIADRHEGKLTFNLKFDGHVTISKECFNILFGRTFNLGGSANLFERGPMNFSVGINALNVVADHGDTITLTDSSVVIKQETPNCFIYCMSNVKNKEDAVGIFPKYDAYWYIREEQHHEFGAALAMSLGGQVGYEHSIGNFILPEATDLRNLKISLQRENVCYLPREIEIKNENSKSLNETLQKLQFPSFVKPPTPFEMEKEFRYIFTFESNGIVIPPIQNSIILRHTAPLLPFLC